ncbi:MAG: tetratricopeptide repeat protein [candidate division WOR-3 bacterium]
MILIFLIAMDMSPLVNKANRLYHKEEYEKAYEIYKEASILYPDKEKIKFNLADCAYMLKRFREAGDEFARLTASNNKEIRQKSFYNLGNVFMEGKQYDQAISSYKQALLLNPKDERAKRNLEIAKMMKKQEQQNQEKENKEKNQEQKQKPQQQQQPKPTPQEKINKALENEQKETMKKALQRKGGRQEEAGKW